MSYIRLSDLPEPPPIMSAENRSHGMGQDDSSSSPSFWSTYFSPDELTLLEVGAGIVVVGYLLLHSMGDPNAGSSPHHRIR